VTRALEEEKEEKKLSESPTVCMPPVQRKEWGKAAAVKGGSKPGQ
jgi:hypothetical protein